MTNRPDFYYDITHIAIQRFVFRIELNTYIEALNGSLHIFVEQLSHAEGKLMQVDVIIELQ